MSFDHVSHWFGQALAFASVFAVVGFEAAMALGRPRTEKSGNEERASGVAMLFLAAVGLFGAFAVSPSARAAFFEPFAPPRYGGFLVVFAGLLVRRTSMGALAEAFSLTPRIHRGQRLVTRGIYGYVRHPAYLGTLLLFAGAAIVYGHPLASAVAVLAPLPGIAYRIRREEALLEEAFGDEYRAYRLRTRFVVPFLL